MDTTRDSHIKWSKSKENTDTIDITYMQNLKHDTNEPIYKTHRYREQTCGCQGGRGRERDRVGGWG